MPGAQFDHGDGERVIENAAAIVQRHVSGEYIDWPTKELVEELCTALDNALERERNALKDAARWQSMKEFAKYIESPVVDRAILAVESGWRSTEREVESGLEERKDG